MVAGLTMVAVPRSLGLVAALAVSGIYLVYEYNKKRALVNIQREKAFWRLEYLYGGSDIPQKQQVVNKESGIRMDIGMEEAQWHQLQTLQKAFRRLPPPYLLLRTLRVHKQESDESGNGNSGTEQMLNDSLVKCEVDEAQLNCIRDNGNYCPQQHSERVTNFSIVVTPPGRVCQSEFQGRQENSDNNLPLTDSCCEDDFSREASLSSVAASSSSQRFSPKGCLVIPGSGKAGGQAKKVVRFSPCVAEPSSDNKAYRIRFKKVKTAPRAAVQMQQRTQVPSFSASVGSISFDRPRQTLVYSAHRYRWRSFYDS